MKAGPEDLADHRGCLVGKPSLIELDNVVRSYQTEGTEVRALDGISLTIRKGEFVAIMGQSGSGKSTLMNILGCLDTPSAGSYTINGHNVNSLTQEQLSALRLKTFGFVFQRYHEWLHRMAHGKIVRMRTVTIISLNRLCETVWQNGCETCSLC